MVAQEDRMDERLDEQLEIAKGVNDAVVKFNTHITHMTRLMYKFCELQTQTADIFIPLAFRGYRDEIVDYLTVTKDTYEEMGEAVGDVSQDLQEIGNNLVKWANLNQ